MLVITDMSYLLDGKAIFIGSLVMGMDDLIQKYLPVTPLSSLSSRGRHTVCTQLFHPDDIETPAAICPARDLCDALIPLGSPTGPPLL